MLQVFVYGGGDIVIPVSYMNDRFAFSSGTILSNRGSTLMWTSITVFSRLEADRISQCRKENENLK